jgi:hypothetical protein
MPSQHQCAVLVIRDQLDLQDQKVNPAEMAKTVKVARTASTVKMPNLSVPHQRNHALCVPKDHPDLLDQWALEDHPDQREHPAMHPVTAFPVNPAWMVNLAQRVVQAEMDLEALRVNQVVLFRSSVPRGQPVQRVLRANKGRKEHQDLTDNPSMVLLACLASLAKTAKKAVPDLTDHPGHWATKDRKEVASIAHIHELHQDIDHRSRGVFLCLIVSFQMRATS